MSEWRFKRDTAFRKQFFVPDSFAHPAKMDAQLLIRIVEEYTKPGEVILDPMAGSGTTMLACTLGRNVVLVELEEKFCKMCRDNWEVVRMRPQLGYTMGDCQIIQGDARSLEGICDKIITSPPYADRDVGYLTHSFSKISDSKLKVRGHLKVDGYSKNPSNLGNLPYGNIDHIITSPPYEESLQGKLTVDNKRKARLRAIGYRDKQGMLSDGGYSQTFGGAYSPNLDNIGNLRGDTYLSAMLQVYQQCAKVLKSGGLMILVTKNFIRNKKEIRLDEDTIKVCEQAGFKFLERHYRKLPAQSFWRTIYKQKYPDAPEITHEDILVFEAPPVRRDKENRR